MLRDILKGGSVSRNACVFLESVLRQLVVLPLVHFAEKMAPTIRARGGYVLLTWETNRSTRK